MGFKARVPGRLVVPTVGVGVGVGPGVPPTAVWTTSSTRLVVASEALKLNPSVLGVSRAIDMKEPALPAVAEVMFTSSHLAVAVPGTKLRIPEPAPGLFPNVIDCSVHELSVTPLRAMAPPEPFVTNILRVA